MNFTTQHAQQNAMYNMEFMKNFNLLYYNFFANIYNPADIPKPSEFGFNPLPNQISENDSLQNMFAKKVIFNYILYLFSAPATTPALLSLPTKPEKEEKHLSNKENHNTKKEKSEKLNKRNF